MRGKVSVVIPCYNKVDYIGTMLDSVIAQNWDNIELILVNDGSTDGTREVIHNYVPRIRARGYELVIVDQENAGCCAAVKAGLERISGEYMCLIDADDALDPAYVSTMAGWLEEHDEYDYCSCDYAVVDSEGNQKSFVPRLWPEETYTPEFFLCNYPSKAAWAFLSKMRYIKMCQLIERFYADTRGSYEPSFLIPFAVYGGRMKHFCLPLYRYSGDAGGLSQDMVFEKKNAYWREYHRVVLLMLDRIPGDVLDVYKKKHLAALSSFFTLELLLLASIWTRADEAITTGLRHEFIAYVNNWLSVNPRINYNEVCENTAHVCRAAELAVSGMWDKANASRPEAGQIIGYGALGQRAAKILPVLQGTAWQPTVLWDQAGDGIAVKMPDFSALSNDDIVLIFPVDPVVIDDVKGALESSKARVLHGQALFDLVACLMFPRFGGIH